ncbi:4'-phosphopantetheinyl transferase family protein [Leifsonia xyli]|uniref:4'-phosphopantetheinyl transferase family protein n=1 Tax=Leifsonia xyli TaxID=1575 RepID=UPI003D67E1A3
MPAFVVVPYGRADITIADRLGEGDRDRLASLAADDERQRAFLAGRAALFAAAAQLGEPGVRIDARCPDCGLSHGRPVAEGGATRIHLALAHAAGAAFAVAARVPIGIDAEPATASAERLAAVDDLAPGRGDALRRWTAIEAVLKADGRGLRVAPSAVRVGRRSAVLDAVRYRLRTSRLDGCVVTVAELLTPHPESDGSRVSRSHASKNPSSGSSA